MKRKQPVKQKKSHILLTFLSITIALLKAASFTVIGKNIKQSKDIYYLSTTQNSELK